VHPGPLDTINFLIILEKAWGFYGDRAPANGRDIQGMPTVRMFRDDPPDKEALDPLSRVSS
jgi:hypothetical protein